MSIILKNNEMTQVNGGCFCYCRCVTFTGDFLSANSTCGFLIGDFLSPEACKTECSIYKSDMFMCASS